MPIIKQIRGEITMFWKRRPLQSRSEIWMRNLSMGFLVLYMGLFLIVPVLIVAVGSLHQWNPLNETWKWIGLENYVRMFSYPTFWQAMINTVIFCLVVVFFRVLLGLSVAYALNSKMTRFKTFFRTVFYMPTVTPLVAVAYVWMIMYNPQFGLIDKIFGLDINWLFDSRFALPAIMAMTIWKDFGYAVILFLSGLMSLPSDCYESSQIDGATAWQTFRYITLPSISPTTFYLLIAGVGAGLLTYDMAALIAPQGWGDNIGGPENMGLTLMRLVYWLIGDSVVRTEDAFASCASVISWVLFLFTGVASMILFRIRDRRMKDVY